MHQPEIVLGKDISHSPLSYEGWQDCQLDHYNTPNPLGLRGIIFRDVTIIE
jgi:hypothetical protein